MSETGNKEILEAIQTLAQHMDDHALVQNFLLSQKGTVHDTARSLGLRGGPSHSDMLRTVRQQQVGGAQQALGHMPTVANPMARQQLGAAPTVAGPRPVAPMQPPAMPKIGMDLWSYARAREKLAELAEDGEHKLQGHIDFQGLDIAVENRKGSVRSGKTSDGHEWHTKMKNDYGYIEAPAKGKDGDSIDCYVGPDKTAPTAYVVHQHKPDGTGHDEDKAMLAFPSKEEAVAAYLKHYDDPKFLGPVSAVPVDRLKEMVAKPTTIDKLSGVGMPMKLPTLGTPFNPTQNVKSLVQRWKAPTPTKPAVKLAPGSPKGAVA